MGAQEAFARATLYAEAARLEALLQRGGLDNVPWFEVARARRLIEEARTPEWRSVNPTPRELREQLNRSSQAIEQLRSLNQGFALQQVASEYRREFEGPEAKMTVSERMDLMVRSGEYSTLKLPSGYQRHHLNQQAVYGIRGEGISLGVRTEAHIQRIHRWLEQNFWSRYREGGDLVGKSPTNAEYGRASERALVETRSATPAQARELARQAREEREARGYREDQPVPKVPDPVRYKKDE